MFERLLRLFHRGHNGGDGLNQRQREAYLDVLIWAMYKDNSLSIGEEDILHSESNTLDWESAIPLEDYINRSVEKVRRIIADRHASRHMLEEIADGLQTPELKRRAIRNCRRIAESDGDLHRKEAAFINEMRQIFSVMEDDA